MTYIFQNQRNRLQAVGPIHGLPRTAPQTHHYRMTNDDDLLHDEVFQQIEHIYGEIHRQTGVFVQATPAMPTTISSAKSTKNGR